MDKEKSPSKGRAYQGLSAFAVASVENSQANESGYQCDTSKGRPHFRELRNDAGGHIQGK